MTLVSENVTCEYHSFLFAIFDRIEMNVLAFHWVSLLNNPTLYCFPKSCEKEAPQHFSPEQR